MINMVYIHDMNEDGTVHPDLIHDLKINKNYDYLPLIFVAACKSGNLDLVKYCMTSTNLTSDIEKNNYMEKGFEQALDCEHMHILSYFIFDLNMQETEKIGASFNRYERMQNLIGKKGKITKEQINNMFKIRESNKLLQRDLPINLPNSNHKKIKL